MRFNRNVGTADRLLRIAAAAGLIIAGFIVSGKGLSILLILLAVPLLGSALLGFCPAYTLFGFDTKREGGGCC